MMSGKKIILVDGYNAINRIPEFRRGLASTDLENARMALALQISGWRRSRGAASAECVIVFDGDAKFSGGREQRLSGIRCMFTRTSHGGDLEIIRFVRDYKGDKSDITVVSDDNNVRNNCRAHGAAVQAVEFIAAPRTIPSPSPTAARASSPNGKRISRKAAAEIDEELRKKFEI